MAKKFVPRLLDGQYHLKYDIFLYLKLLKHLIALISHVL